MADEGIRAQATVLSELAELCRNHDVSLDLIRHSDDIDVLLDRVLEEYETRLAEISPTALADPRPDDASKVRALVMFAAQAAAQTENPDLDALSWRVLGTAAPEGLPGLEALLRDPEAVTY